MTTLTTLTELFRYGSLANELIFAAAGRLTDEQLDRPLDLGLGSVRRICQHLAGGEVTWLARIEGNVEAKYPAQPIPHAIADMLPLLRSADARRQVFLQPLAPAQLGRTQRYRDSKGSLFEATLHEMLLQMIVHATHHRAQVVNAIRRAGGQPPEVDYMVQVRRPA